MSPQKDIWEGIKAIFGSIMRDGEESTHGVSTTRVYKGEGQR